MTSRIALLILTVLAPGAVALERNPRPQEPQKPAEPVVRVAVNLVQIDAVVTDRQGRQVTDLAASDFEVLQDGRPQTITNFSYVALGGTPSAPRPRPAAAPGVAAAPVRPAAQTGRTVAIVVDDLGLSFESVAEVRDAVVKFIDARVAPSDRVAILRTGGGIASLQQFTTDRRQLRAAVERIRWNPMGRGGVSAFAPIRSDPAAAPAEEESTSGAGDNLEAFREELFSVGTLGAIRYVVRGLRQLPGRKAVVVFSEGFRLFDRDRDNRRVLDALRQLTDDANRSSVVLYTIDARGLQPLGLTAADDLSNKGPLGGIEAARQRSERFHESRDPLYLLAEDTGGLFLRDSNDLAELLGEVFEDQKGYYLIGYVPESSTFEPRRGVRAYHKIAVRVKRLGLRVRSRSGFFGVSDPDPAARPAPRTRPAEQTAEAAIRIRNEQLLEALHTPFAAPGLDLRLTSLFLQDETGGPLVRSLLHVDGRQLSFQDAEEDWKKAVIDVLAVTYADSGQIVDHMNRTFTIRVRGDDYRRTLERGLICTLNVPIKKPGAYQLRTALRDAASERVGSASQFVEIPDVRKKRLALSGIILRGVPGATAAAPPSHDSQRSAAAVAERTEGQVSEPDPQASPALRRFRRGMALDYTMVIYNALFDRNRRGPVLETQIRLFRDGRQIYEGPVRPFRALEASAAKPHVVAGHVGLGTQVPPGEYLLEITVRDKLAGRRGTAKQWIDFEIAG